MRRILTASSGWLCKTFAATGLGPLSLSSSAIASKQLQHKSVVWPQPVVSFCRQLCSTHSFVSDDEGSSGRGDVAATPAGSVSVEREASMLDTSLPTEMIEHLTASECFDNGKTLLTCTPSELSRFITAIHPSPSTPVAVFCNILEQRASELTADELSAALCNLLHLSQLCLPSQPSSQPQPLNDAEPTALSVCCSLASKLLGPPNCQDLSTSALIHLLSACLRAQHLLPGLDLHATMEGSWMQLLEESGGSTLLQQLPADEFVQLLTVGSRLQTPSGIPQKADVSSKQHAEEDHPNPTTTTANAFRASGYDFSKRWHQIMLVLQGRVSTGDFNVAQLGELAKTLNKRTGHWVMHDSISGSDDESSAIHHSPPLATVIHAIIQLLPFAPLEEVAAAARSLGQAHLLGEAQLLQACSDVLGESILRQLSPVGLGLWLEAISRAVVDARRSCNSRSEKSANSMLSSAHSLWLEQGASQGSTTQQLVPLFWALGRARLLPASDLRMLLSTCDSAQWVSVGAVDTVQLVYASLKVHLWKDLAATGLAARVQQLLPVMNVHTLSKLVQMLQRTGHGGDTFSQKIWQALHSALPHCSNQELWTLFKLADTSQQPQLRGLIVKQAIARLNMPLDAPSCQPLILLICVAAASKLVYESAKQDVFQRVKLVLRKLQDHQLASLAFHLPSLGQVDQPLADQVAAIAVELLSSSSLTFLARTLSGVARLRGGGVSDHYSLIMKHVVTGVTEGCSQQDLFHVSAWMLEDHAVFGPELTVAVAAAVIKLAPEDLSCNVVVQLAQLISRGILAADVAPLLLQALPHREFIYTADQLTLVLSMLYDESIVIPQRFIIRLLILMKHLSDPQHLLRPVSLQLYNIFEEQQHTGSPQPSSVQSHQSASNMSEDATATTSRPIHMPFWLREFVRDPTVVLMQTAESQLCNVAQQWAWKFHHLDSLLYTRLQLIAAKQSPRVSVDKLMVDHGCNESDHPDLVALIASAPAVVLGQRKRFIL